MINAGALQVKIYL